MKTNKRNLTIGIPAFNEQDNIDKTLETVYLIAKNTLDEFEIIVLDDGSSDQTFDVAKKTADKLGHNIEVLRNEMNQGVGSAFKMFLNKASYPYITLIPGDNAYTSQGIRNLLSSVGQAELVISYRGAMKQRTMLRFILSKIATQYLRLISGKKILDAHSLFIFPVEFTKKLNIQNTGYGYHMETLSRLLRRTNSLREIPVELTPSPDASSGVMKPKVLFTLGVTMLKLVGLRLCNRL